MSTSRLTIPQMREAPPDVVRQLREIDPRAELVYMGDGVWLLGSVERTNLRERTGRLKVQRATEAKIETPRQLARWRYVMWEGQLLMQGFSPLRTFVGDPDSAIVEYLRVRDYQWARELDARWAQIMAEPEDPDEAAWKEKQDVFNSTVLDEHRLREAWRWGFRRPQSITVNGLRAVE